MPPALRPALTPAASPADGEGLLLSEEDLYLPEPGAYAALAVCEPVTLEPVPASDRVMAFKRAAVADTLTRARRDQVAGTVAGVAVEDVADWARDAQLTRLYVPHVCQSPLAAQLPALREALEAVGCELEAFTRTYDRLAWPHATKGFFQLKKRIPELLTELKAGDAAC